VGDVTRKLMLASARSGDERATGVRMYSTNES
jgi:hypothetical protein